MSIVKGKIANALNVKVILELGNHKVDPIYKAKGYDSALEKIKELICSKIITFCHYFFHKYSF